MRKSRRLLAMLLAVMMAISALPLGIFAEETATVQPEPEVGLYWCKYRGVSNNMPVYNADKASDSMQYYTDESVNAVFLFWNGVQFVLLKDKELSFPEGVEHQEMEGGFGGVSLSFTKALTGSIVFTNAVGTYTIDVEVKELSLPVAGFYGECNRSMDTWIGNGRDHVIEGTAKEMKTVYLLWDTEVLKEVSSVALSFEDASNEKDILNNAPLDADTADILAQHGITVTSMLAKGYLQVDTGFVDARNLEIFLTDEDGQTYSAHLSIDEVVSDEEEQPVGRAVDLYWSKFHGMSDGEPVYNADSANDHMWDEVGQDINAVFLFWDGETFSEVPFEELSFPKGLTYSQNKEYANAVYMVFDKALVGDITYTKDGQTYAFPLEVEDLTGEDDEETDEKFTGAVGLYWNYVKLYPDGAPICDISGAKNFMNDYVGQDIDAMFLFWDGETASVVPYELLNIPKTVDYRESEEHSSAVYMKFNTPLEDYITYTRDDVTYQFPLTVKEEEDASDTLVSVGFFDEPVRSEDSWIKKEIISGYSGDTGRAWLMWDTELFEVDDKGDVLVYLEKNEDEGIELESSIWDDHVDALLADYGVTLALDVKNQYIEVTADFGKVGGTLDFALTLSDTKGEKTEAQLNIDMEEESAAGTLKWCWVNRENGVYLPQTDYLSEEIWMEPGDEQLLAIYLQQGNNKTLIPYEDLIFKGEGFSVEVNEEDERFFWFCAESSGSGSIRYKESGTTYVLPVTVELPYLGFYSRPERCDDAFMGSTLTYTGENDVYYVILRDEKVIQSVELMRQADIIGADEIRVVIAEDGTYATLYLGENLQPDKTHNITVQSSNGSSSRVFRFRNGKAGLRWCWVDDSNEEYTLRLDSLNDEFLNVYDRGNGSSKAFCFCEGDQVTPVELQDLEFPSFLKPEIRFEDQDMDWYLIVKYNGLGSGDIIYRKDGVEYSLPARVDLPDLGLYTEARRAEETYTYRTLNYTGENTVYYLFAPEGWSITDVRNIPAFMTVECPADRDYAVVTLDEGFTANEWYELAVSYQNDEGVSNYNYTTSFVIRDARPGLRWVYLRWDDNDNLYEDMEDVRSDLDYSMNDSVRAAFYFVDGDKWERLSPEVLQFPDFLKLEQMEEHEDYVRVRFRQFGSGEVTYERDGVTYTMPASVGLPGMSYYTEPVRSEATYMGDELIFDGKDADGNAVTKETFYLMVQDGWNITKLEFTDGQPDFVSYEIVDGYAVVTISEGFNDERYEVKAYAENIKDPDRTDDWWANFEVVDERPGLKWKWVDFGGDGQFPFVPEDEEFQSIISHRMDSGVTVAVYYVDGDTEVLIPKKKLILPDFVEIEPNTDAEGGDYFFWLSFLAVGEGEITCADYPGCGLPVVSELPFIALYSQPEAKEEYLLNSKNLSLDFSEEAEDGRRYATVYIVPAQEDWTLTGLQMGGNGNDDPMNFVDYAVNKAENYIELKVYDEYLPDWYSLKVYHTYPDGEKGDRWVEFRLADKPILQWMQVMEADGSYAITGGSRSLSLQPGESQLMAVCYTYNNDMVPLDYDDLIFPDFLSVERLDEDDPTLLRVLSTGLGEGSITSKTYPDLRLRVVSSREMLGYYTLPELNGDALNNRLNSVDGQDIVRWLIWDPAQLPDVTDVTLTLKNEEHTILVDDVRASSADLSQWGITVTLDLEAGHMKLVAKEGDWYNLTAKVWQDEDYERITVNLNSDPNEWGHIWDDGLPVIWYEGVPYSFFIAMGEEDMERIDDVGNFGSSGGGIHDSKLVIGAMGWYDTDKEEEAPEEVLKAIKNVQFRIGKFHNFDASGDQMECNFKEPENIECNLHGKTLHGIYTETYDGMYVYAEFIATFTVELPGMEPQTFTMNTIGHRLPDRSIDLDMTSLTTAAELNAVLSSGDALMTWVKANQPKVYAQFKALEAIEGRAMFARFSATLAPVVFEDVIVVSNEYVCLNLSGSVDEEGNRTTMPGMWLKNHDTSFIEGIDFVADAGKTMTWGKEKAFTCGILAGGEDRNSGDSYGGDAYGVDDCTFTGFDYGIRCTEYSYTAPGRGCTFVDCEYGYYVDCGKKTGGNANSDVTQCRFINCGTAIRIKALPNYVSPYDLVISNNDFINNKWDIDLSVRGRFFFNGNYYGYTADGSVPEVRADYIYRTARVHGRGYATIIVNPRWQLPCTFAGPNKLVMDIHKGLNNYMINENADKNPIDSKTLAYDLGLYTEAELLRIIMTDDSENNLGTWTFSGTKDSESLSLLDAAEVNDTFNAELVFGEDAAGNPTVTIQDSSILSGGNVKLTVPCSFWDAKVTVNGQEVDASVANGQVTFTVIGGGTYVIHEVELEEIEDAFITGGAAESNPDAGDEPVTQPKAEVDMGWYNYDHSETGEDTAPKFATVTTEDQQVAKEIDPDADLDDVVEGEEKVEEKTETTQIVTVQAIYQAPAAAEPGDTVSDVVVLLVLYDQSGQMIAMHQQVAQQNDGTRVITVQCDAALLSSNAVTVKAFVISASGDMRPLAPVPFSQTLTFNEN